MESSIKSGRTLRQAIENRASGRSKVFQGVAKTMLSGDRDAAVSYFTTSTFNEMDVEVIKGAESGGHLEEAMGHLKKYYGVMAKAKKKVVSSLIYPIFVLHFGAIALAVPLIVTDGIPAFMMSAFRTLAVFYVIGGAVTLVTTLLIDSAKKESVSDRVLRRIPVIGGVWVAIIGTRFCLMMNMLVRSGVGILSALEASGRASQSAMFATGATAASQSVRSGGTLTASIVNTHAFTEDIEQGFETGEESGHIDDEMGRLAKQYETAAEDKLEVVATWLPKIVFIVIMLTLAWKIIGTMSAYYATMKSLM